MKLYFLLFALFILAGCKKEMSVLINSNSETNLMAKNALTITPAISEVNIPAFWQLVAAMKHNLTNDAICILGDSTGNDDFEWVFRVFVTWLLQIFPTYEIHYYVWNTNTDNYDPVRTIYGARHDGHVLIVYNGSRPGASINYFNASRLKLMMPAKELYETVMLSCSHNDQPSDTTAAYFQKVTGLLENIKKIDNDAQEVILTQNPEIPPRSEAQIIAHSIRRNMYIEYGAINRIPVIDTFGAFLKDGRPLDQLIQTDQGIHPNVQGQIVWANDIIFYLQQQLRYE